MSRFSIPTGLFVCSLCLLVAPSQTQSSSYCHVCWFSCLFVCLFVCLFMLMILSRQINQLLISRMRWPQAVPLWIGPFLWFSSLTIKKERISLSIGKMVCFHAFNTTTIVRWGQQQTGRWSMIESNWDIVCWNVSIGSVVIIDCIWPSFVTLVDCQKTFAKVKVNTVSVSFSTTKHSVSRFIL